MNKIIGLVIAIPMFFLGFLMFVYVMTTGSLAQMIFVNLMVVGGYVVLYRAYKKPTIMTIELDPL